MQHLQLALRFQSTSYEVRVLLANDAKTWISASWSLLSDAPHALELDWRASTAAGANNGGLMFWIDAVQHADLTGVDNDTRRIAQVRLGAVSGIANSISCPVGPCHCITISAGLITYFITYVTYNNTGAIITCRYRT